MILLYPPHSLLIVNNLGKTYGPHNYHPRVRSVVGTLQSLRSKGVHCLLVFKSLNGF